MLDSLEPYLARWTGRSNWPTVRATLEEHITIPQNDQIGTLNTETADLFSYEVDGKVHVADLLEVLGEKNIMGHVGNKVLIQYNPRRPGQWYYAPACQLASRAVLVLTLLGAALAILLAVHFHS
jgi:hypothetical protein